MDLLQDKAFGVLAGAAVGDALGGAAEGNTPEAIQERYGGFIEGIVPPFHEDWRNARPIAPNHYIACHFPRVGGEAPPLEELERMQESTTPVSVGSTTVPA